MKDIVIPCGLSTGRWPVLLTLVWVGIASLGPVLRAEAQAARTSGTGVPRNRVTATVTVGQSPDCLAITPDSQIVYVANPGSNTISVIYVENHPAIEATVTISNDINSLALSLDGKTLYVSEEPQGPGPGVVEVYSVAVPASPTLTTTLTAGYYPQGMTISADGSQLYVANGNSGVTTAYASPALDQNPGAIYVFNTATSTLSNIIVTNGFPFQVLLTGNGSQADVLNEIGPGFIQYERRTSVHATVG
jgi:DNA-binding beta-propeller fold protein YncE